MEQNQLEQKKQVQVQTESRHLKSGDEKFEIAISGTKIISSSIEDIKQVLRVTMLKLGMRANNLPSDEEKLILIDHIIEFHGRHTCEEVKLAFDLAIAGKLDIDVNAYENFSCLYFSKVMNSYKEWSKEPMRKIQDRQRRKELPYENRYDISDAEMQEWYDDLIIKIETYSTHNFLSDILYEWLVKKGVICLSDEEKKILFDRAIKLKLVDDEDMAFKYSFAENKYKMFKMEVERNEFNEITENLIKKLAKKLALYEHLKNKKNEMLKSELQAD